MEPLPWIFPLFQYFLEILPLIESLWCALQDEIHIMGLGAAGGNLWFFFNLKNAKNTQFYPKMAWPPATYDAKFVTIATDSHQICVIMCIRDMPTVTENGWCWWKIALEKLKKNLMGGGIPLPLVRPKVKKLKRSLYSYSRQFTLYHITWYQIEVLHRSP